jgi:hypothetical protein
MASKTGKGGGIPAIESGRGGGGEPIWLRRR